MSVLRTKELPPLFGYMEVGDWEKAADRLRRHPREVRTWATLRTKSQKPTKRLALHHACFKLRSAGSMPIAASSEDAFVQVCRFILLLIRLYPEAAGTRETRHGCLPLHLACFASCAPRAEEIAASTPSSTNKPNTISRRVASDATTDTNLSAVHAEENYTGIMADTRVRRKESNPNVRVAAKGHVFISTKREELAVEVLNALLDAHPKAIRTDSEGGRLPLHTACAGRATPRVLQTLLTAYPSAARHRNLDGFLPLHLAAHWGVSHPNVVIYLLKAYPDATVGRNRWERTPLEEALCMAGENGRPHQTSLVRALRKHPSFWTRATPEILGPSLGRNIVDMDESLPSNDSNSLEQERFWSTGQEQCMEEITPKGLVARLSPKPKKKLSLEEIIRQNQWTEVIERVEDNPNEAEVELVVMTKGGFLSSSGTSPLYYACERDPPVTVVQALIHANPLAVLTRAMPGGALPLHVACTWHASVEVVQLLLSADQGSAMVADELGNLALHSACFSGASVGVIQALVSTDAQAILGRNHQGSRPSDIVKRLRHDHRDDVLEILQRSKQKLLRHQRSQSSGTWASTAQEAMELNHLEDGGNPLLEESAIEVSYDKTGEDLVWI